jgi:hypothetical protein
MGLGMQCVETLFKAEFQFVLYYSATVLHVLVMRQVGRRA